MELPGEWRDAGGLGPDFLSTDGRLALEVKSRAQGGLRDLRASAMKMAAWLVQQPNVSQGILAINIPRITLQRMQQAWSEIQAALRPNVARRMAIIAVVQDTRWTSPPSPELEKIADAVFSQVTLAGSAPTAATVTNRGTSSSLYDSMKVLLEAWLRRAGPLQIQEVARRTGCSYPTTALALKQLESRGELKRSRDRRAELSGLPRRTLEEATVLSETLRQTRWIIDVSGRPGDPTRLLRRLERATPPDVAIGGVVGARHYHRAFDLNGTPRLDLSIWARRGESYEPTIINELDAGLLLVPVYEPGAVAAVHRLSRGQPLFEKVPHGLPYTDPVEVLLDLYELRLDAQAQAFVQHLRGEAT